MSDVALHGFVEGRVQGVSYRASAAREARRLGVRGYARNLPDGRVEVLLVGSAGPVAELGRWLERGPPLAQVTRVMLAPVAIPDIEGFRTE